ncbi:hypothetical protein N658DRAFT_341440 [Parathielavia hyrcaniae]|uniref:Uncharacterized protein n=1 Tax=Parathielavia hyrcaniae TaxID=113614 RepID=A0AAN6Q2Y8_9PEZI|nr:hypothetical protein N658DRAFT_341440 [Parathielavia hyrcaniae]
MQLVDGMALAVWSLDATEAGRVYLLHSGTSGVNNRHPTRLNPPQPPTSSFFFRNKFIVCSQYSVRLAAHRTWGLITPEWFASLTVPARCLMHARGRTTPWPGFVAFVQGSGPQRAQCIMGSSEARERSSCAFLLGQSLKGKGGGRRQTKEARTLAVWHGILLRLRWYGTNLSFWVGGMLASRQQTVNGF